MLVPGLVAEEEPLVARVMSMASVASVTSPANNVGASYPVRTLIFMAAYCKYCAALSTIDAMKAMYLLLAYPSIGLPKQRQTPYREQNNDC